MLKLSTLTLVALLTAGTAVSAQQVGRAASTDDFLATAPTFSGEAHGPFAYDRSTRTLFVRGESYFVPEQVNTVELWGADEVALNWTQQGDRRVVESYSAERSDG